jgi:hypothetical protein
VIGIIFFEVILHTRKGSARFHRTAIPGDPKRITSADLVNTSQIRQVESSETDPRNKVEDDSNGVNEIELMDAVCPLKRTTVSSVSFLS